MTQTLTVEQRIRQTVAAIANSAGWTSLTLLRALLADIDRDVLDAELHRMRYAREVNIVPAAAQRRLTDADRAAALRIGMTDCHLIALT